ncbi:hypothetical protein B9Z65_1212 [Elsinoe australis]|uniref:Uncharacterized protein n=1 Tax=Elsinoe australis TaxID=40998 RepID=A0A2P7YPY1_9PEZI|nr:hypothetical protein B9Z65_1212 [Elsinoe australis]
MNATIELGKLKEKEMASEHLKDMLTDEQRVGWESMWNEERKVSDDTPRVKDTLGTADPGYIYAPPQLMQAGHLRNRAATKSPTQNNTLLLVANETVPISHDLLDLFYDPHCVFYMSFHSRTQIMYYFHQLFDISDNPIPLGDTYEPDWGCEVAPTFTNMHLMPLWNIGNVTMEGVDQCFERVASTMTAVLRSTVNTTKPANQPVIGTTTVIKTCAAVTWP